MASVLFYLEVWTRLHGKLACTQLNCSWLLPTYVKEVNYAKVANIDFTSARKLKAALDHSINKLDVTLVNYQSLKPVQRTPVASRNPPIQRIKRLFCFPQCLQSQTRHPQPFHALCTFCCFQEPEHSNHPRSVPRKEPWFSYPELLKECYSVKDKLTDEEIDQIEKDTVEKAKGKAFILPSQSWAYRSLQKQGCNSHLPSTPFAVSYKGNLLP